jgi:hypothetical protein
MRIAAAHLRPGDRVLFCTPDYAALTATVHRREARSDARRTHTYVQFADTVADASAPLSDECPENPWHGGFGTSYRVWRNETLVEVAERAESDRGDVPW